MTDLRSRVEAIKLARELGIDESELAFLSDVHSSALRDLRTAVSNGLFARQRGRFELLAALTRLVPSGVSAKIAELALGPLISSRVAACLKPADAAKLAGGLSPAFLTDVAAVIDPARVIEIIPRLTSDRVVEVGRDLLARGELLTLGRFVPVVDLDVILGVVEVATPADLLNVALFTEDPTALEAVIQRLPDETIRAVIDVAAERGQFIDAVTLLAALSDESRVRLITFAAELDDAGRSGVVAAIIDNDVWDVVLPALRLADPATRARVRETVALTPGLVDVLADLGFDSTP